MKKCPNCGRSYSDMVQVCPACNITLGGSTSVPKPAAKERPREERKETVVREEKVAQKKPKQKSAKNTSPAPAPKGPSPLVGVVALVVLVGIMFYMNSQAKAKQAAVERSNPTVQATEEKNLSAAGTSASESKDASVTIDGSVQYAKMMGEPEIQNGKIVANFEGENFYYCAVIQADVAPGEYSLDENNGLEVYSKNGGGGELFSEGCTVEDGYVLQIDMRANFKTGQTFISGTFRLNSEESQSKISTFSFSVAVPTSELPQGGDGAQSNSLSGTVEETQNTGVIAEQPIGGSGQAEVPENTEQETQAVVSAAPDTAVLRIDGTEYTFYLDKARISYDEEDCFAQYLCKGANGAVRYEFFIDFNRDIQPGTFHRKADKITVIMKDRQTNREYYSDKDMTITITEASRAQATYAGRLEGKMASQDDVSYTIESCEFRFAIPRGSFS